MLFTRIIILNKYLWLLLGLLCQWLRWVYLKNVLSLSGEDWMHDGIKDGSHMDYNMFSTWESKKAKLSSFFLLLITYVYTFMYI